MPKIKKFRELSRRQQNRRLLLAARNEKSIIASSFSNNNRDMNNVTCLSNDQNVTELCISPEIRNEQTDVNIECAQTFHLLENNIGKQKKL